MFKLAFVITRTQSSILLKKNTNAKLYIYLKANHYIKCCTTIGHELNKRTEKNNNMRTVFRSQAMNKQTNNVISLQNIFLLLDWVIYTFPSLTIIFQYVYIAFDTIFFLSAVTVIHNEYSQNFQPLFFFHTIISMNAIYKLYLVLQWSHYNNV